MEAGTVQRLRGAWGRWLEGSGRAAGRRESRQGPSLFLLPPPPASAPPPLAGPSRRRPDSPDTRPPPARRRSRPAPAVTCSLREPGSRGPGGPPFPRGPGLSARERLPGRPTHPCTQWRRFRPPGFSDWNAGAQAGSCPVWVSSPGGGVRGCPPTPCFPQRTDALLPPSPPSVEDAGAREHHAWKWTVLATQGPAALSN